MLQFHKTSLRDILCIVLRLFVAGKGCAICVTQALIAAAGAARVLAFPEAVRAAAAPVATVRVVRAMICRITLTPADGILPSAS